MVLILHITPESHWQTAQQTGIYHADSLEMEGFIHCSTLEQVVATANTYFRGQAGLVLLCIESDRVQAEIRYETVNGSQFPHLYGLLNLDAVTQVLAFEPDASGCFVLPSPLVG